MTETKLIAIEGASGTGCTTQARILVKSLRSLGYSVYAARSPYGASPYYAAIEGVHKDRYGEARLINGNTLLALTVADRIFHWQDCLLPALDSDYHYIVLDRWHKSTVAYQSLTSSYDSDYIYSTLKMNVPDADISVVLDSEDGYALFNILDKDEVSSLDMDTSFQMRARNNFRRLYPQQLIAVDTLVEKTSNDILDRVLSTDF